MRIDRVQYIQRVKRFKSFIRRRFSIFKSKVVILLYHRVTELSSDPQLLSVTARNFIKHLEYLRSNFDIISLYDFVSMLKEKRLPQKETAILTFDDGYADNLYNAKPLLERYDVPATFFLTSGHIGKEYEFWWDDLERLLLAPNRLPKMLMLTINGKNFQWDLGENAYYTQEDHNRYRSWNVLEKRNPTRRHYIYRDLLGLLDKLYEGERSKVLANLASAASMGLSARPTHKVLSQDEILRLADTELIEIGAHTINHLVLSDQPISVQETEICRNKQDLERILNSSVRSFSYPYGRRSDYTKETKDIIRKAGFGCACCAFSGLIWHEIDPFQLPRLLIRDYDQQTFASITKGSLHA